MKTLLKSINYPRMALMGLLGFLMPYGLTGIVIAYSLLTSTNPRHEGLEVFDLSSEELQSVFIGFYDATLQVFYSSFGAALIGMAVFFVSSCFRAWQLQRNQQAVN